MAARQWRARTASPTASSSWSDASVSVLIAALIAAGPLLTIGGAKLLAGRERAAAAGLEAEAWPRIEAARAATEARRQIEGLLRRRTIGATLEALARALPPDASLVRVAQNERGSVELEIEAADPDRLRAALRRVPAFARLRNTGQRQGDARMIVTFAGAVS